MAKLALTMALLQVRYRHMPPRALKILFVILSCWAIRQWIYYSGYDTQAQITLPISLANNGTVVGIDETVVDIHYAAYVSDKSTIIVHTNTTGVWGFRAIIIGY